MARCALAQGYKADGDDRFFHSDGSWIGRTSGARFPWERRVAAGGVLRHYYPKEHCLEREPLQIEADVWGLVDQKPDIYSFRSEERRVGKECVNTCRSRWSPYH